MTIEFRITFANPRANSTLHNFALLYAAILENRLGGGDKRSSLSPIGGNELNRCDSDATTITRERRSKHDANKFAK